jgi:ParB family chromosome partitioning protein
MSVEKFLSYRGAVRAIAGAGGLLAFVTQHAEGRPTGLYRLDADALTLDEEPLPRGGVALVAAGETLWVAGGDGRVYRGSIAGAEPRPIGPGFPAPPTALAALADDRLAVLVGSEVVLLEREGGRTLQTLELPEPGTCLAADPTGRWLAAGTAQGTVAVFDSEGRSEFLLSETARLHEGAVSALLFEPDELRFLSVGADGRLLSTHARGTLEPEDKGRGNNHSDLVTALIWGPGDRLYSAAGTAPSSPGPAPERSSRRRSRTASGRSSPWRWSPSAIARGWRSRATTTRCGSSRSMPGARSASGRTASTTRTRGPGAS